MGRRGKTLQTDKRTYAWLVVALLWGVCFFNYADRQAIFSVFPPLKAEFALTDASGRLSMRQENWWGAPAMRDDMAVRIQCRAWDWENNILTRITRRYKMRSVQSVP